MVQPHGAERVLEVLKTANKVLSKRGLAALCLVARRITPLPRPCGRPISAEPRAFQAPSSGAGEPAQRLEKQPGRRITLACDGTSTASCSSQAKPRLGAQHAAPMAGLALWSQGQQHRQPETKRQTLRTIAWAEETLLWGNCARCASEWAVALSRAWAICTRARALQRRVVQIQISPRQFFAWASLLATGQPCPCVRPVWPYLHTQGLVLRHSLSSRKRHTDLRSNCGCGENEAQCVSMKHNLTRQVVQ